MKKKLSTYLIGVICLMFMTPTYFNLFTVYSMCNLHDVSWGNREGGGAADKMKVKMEAFRAYWFVVYILANCLYAYVVIVYSTSYGSQGNTHSFQNYYLTIFGMSILLIILVKIFLGSMYNIHFRCCVERKIKRLKMKRKKYNKKL